jgi:hypothetical protein
LTRTYYIGGSGQLFHDDAAVGTCLTILVVSEPSAETLHGVSSLTISELFATTHRVAICVSTRYGVRLVEHAVTDLAREM